jgi:PAS domain S-box-containing protein
VSNSERSSPEAQGDESVHDRRSNPAAGALKDRALDVVAEGITIADARMPDRPLIYANRGFERLTGYSAESVLGRNCRFLQGEGTDPRTVAEIRHAIREERECVVEILNYRQDGTQFWNRLSITPIKDAAGTVTHFIGVQSDVTARKQAEEELAQSNTQLEEANLRISQDLEMAARIQASFLPEETVCVAGADVAWELRSCDELAGDTLNVLPLDDRHVEFYVIDVSGHGVPAALLSVTLNHLLSPASSGMVMGRFAVEQDGEGLMAPVDIVSTLNKQFPFDKERHQYFSLVYGVYDTKSRIFHFVSAGHPPLIHVARSGEICHDWVEGVPIGILPDFAYKQNALQLEPGERVYLYSDGLTDAFDSKQEPYGLERLKSVLYDTRHQTLKASVASVIADVEAWSRQVPFEDDVSILAFEVQE